MVLPLLMHLPGTHKKEDYYANPGEERQDKSTKQQRLHVLVRAMRIFHSQYNGTEWFTAIVEQVIRFVQAIRLDQKNPERGKRDGIDSKLDLALLLAIDICLSKARYPTDGDIMITVERIFGKDAKGPEGSQNIAMDWFTIEQRIEDSETPTGNHTRAQDKNTDLSAATTSGTSSLALDTDAISQPLLSPMVNPMEEISSPAHSESQAADFDLDGHVENDFIAWDLDGCDVGVH